MKQLEIIDSDIDGIRVVAPVGEIDLATAPMLREHLLATLSTLAGLADSPHPTNLGDPAERPALVVRLDLVSFIDSSGVSALVAAYRRARNDQTEFRLAAPSAHVAKVLNITGIGTYIPTFTSLREARKPLSSQRVVPAARTPADHPAQPSASPARPAQPIPARHHPHQPHSRPAAHA